MASWAPPIGDERARPKQTLLSQLLAKREQMVAPPRPLPPAHPQNNLVSTPHTLPPQIGYGSTQMGKAQSQRFTGGVSQNPLSLVQPQDTSFQAPSYGQPSQPVGVAPRQSSSPAGLSPLAAALSPPPGGISGPTPSRPPAGSPQYGPAAQAFIQQYGQTPSVFLPQQQTIRSQTAPAPIAQVQPPLGQTLATAAQRGYKPIYQI